MNLTGMTNEELIKQAMIDAFEILTKIGQGLGWFEIQEMSKITHGIQQTANSRLSMLPCESVMPLNVKTIAAQIIGSAAMPDFRTLTIDKGTRDGLRSDMAVIAPSGVVGRVVDPLGRSAKVQLIVDRNAGAGVIIERMYGRRGP